MLKEEKELLIQDLGARLPYGVIISVKDINNFQFDGILHVIGQNWCRLDILDPIKKARVKNPTIPLEYIKPYLRPLSSMTEDEKNELKEYLDAAEVDYNGFGYSEGGTLEDYISSIPYSICSSVVDWLNKKMFDFRGLIPRGRAISTEEFNPYEN